MLILSRVCAEFRNAKGEKIFAVTPATRQTFQEAPESIREDPLFIHLHPATKGVMAGNESYDDRSYIRFKV